MPYVEGRTVGEQQKNSTFKPHFEGRTVGRQQKNQQGQEIGKLPIDEDIKALIDVDDH